MLIFDRMIGLFDFKLLYLVIVYWTCLR